MPCINVVDFTAGNGRCTMNPEAMQFFSQMDPNVDVAVIVVAGGYRMGKSYLLNKLINSPHPDDGFVVGSTVQACTKGIWMHTTPIDKGIGENGRPYETYVLDTEGTGALDSDNSHDVRVFAIAQIGRAHV